MPLMVEPGGGRFCKSFAKSPFFTSNFGISMPPAHFSVSPHTFKFTPPSMFQVPFRKSECASARLSNMYAKDYTVALNLSNTSEYCGTSLK